MQSIISHKITGQSKVIKPRTTNESTGKLINVRCHSGRVIYHHQGKGWSDV